MKIIVLSISKYKENDFIFNALTESGMISFKSFRTLEAKSQCVWLNNPLTVADIEFSDRRYKYPSLKEAKLISSPLEGEHSLEYLYAVQAIAEIINRLFQDNEKHILFNDIVEAGQALKSGADPLLVVSIFLARAAKITGSGLEVEHCVYCDKTSEIVAFSFADGGFLCRKHASEQGAETDLTPNQMRYIRYIFKVPFFTGTGAEKFTDEDKKIVLKRLKAYADDISGVVLNSLDYLIK